MKTIYFIRHAQSQANAGQATFDNETIGLTETGEQQARQLAQTLTGTPDLIICSKYIRTQLTAVPVIAKLPNTPVDILPLHEFTYLSPTICAGTTAHRRQNWVFDYWESCNPSFVHGVGAESFDQFMTRIEECLAILQTDKAQNMYVFTHGYVLRAIWQILLGHKFPSEYERMHHFHHHMGLLEVPNTCIFKANFNNNEWQIVEPQLQDFLFP